MNGINFLGSYQQKYISGNLAKKYNYAEKIELPHKEETDTYESYVERHRKQEVRRAINAQERIRKSVKRTAAILASLAAVLTVSAFDGYDGGSGTSYAPEIENEEHEFEKWYTNDNENNDTLSVAQKEIEAIAEDALQYTSEDEGLAVIQTAANKGADKAAEASETAEEKEVELTPFQKDFKKIKKFNKGVFKDMAPYIEECAKEFGINPYLVASIMAQETKWGKEVYYNNPAGLMDPETNWEKLIHFETLEKGIHSAVSNLSKRYIEEELTTINDIGDEYCPVDAPNDQKYHLNKYWKDGVLDIYEQITGKDISKDTDLQKGYAGVSDSKED